MNMDPLGKFAAVNISKNLLAGALLLAACGCISVGYKGYTCPPTNYVKLFFSKENLPQGKYEQIGKALATAPSGYSSNDIYKKLMEKARSVGANAILITSHKKELIGREAGPDFTDIGDPDPPSMYGTLPIDSTTEQPVYENSFGDKEYLNANNPQYEVETLVCAVFYRLKGKTSTEKKIDSEIEASKGKDYDENPEN